MTEQHLMAVELRRRADLLPREVAAWKATADTDTASLGIHKSQITTLKEMMDALLKEDQAPLLTGLDPEAQAPDFAHAYDRLLMNIVGLQSLWGVFRDIFVQRHDERLRDTLRQAGLIAAGCYRDCLEQAQVLELLPSDRFREPPLVYLAAEVSPATANRGTKIVETLDSRLAHYRAQKLPIPIILLPIDQVECLWLYATLHHEVGHNIDQDLGLADTIRELLGERLQAAAVPGVQREVWQRWTEEILADAFGVLLGGAGFAHTLVGLLRRLAPLTQTVVTNDDHPDHTVRILLLAELLRHFGAKASGVAEVPALTAAASEIRALWEAMPKPAGATDYTAQCELVARVVMTEKLAALGKHALRQLAPDRVRDAAQVGALAHFLVTGQDQPAPESFPQRLVPPAAQLAFRALTAAPGDQPDLPARLDQLQQRALQHLQAHAPQQFLAAGPDRRTFYRQLVQELKLFVR
jgi:hypothetical protein